MSEEAVRAWVRLPSGKRLDLLNPEPMAWDHEDLAIGLARTYRWGGHSAWPLPLSVAQHSLTVLALFRQAAPAPVSAHDELRELLHDADEGLLGFDAITVIKPFLGEGFRALASRLQDAVFQRYGIRYWNDDEKIVHKRADRIAAASEAVYVAGWREHEVQQVLKIPFQPERVDPLQAIYGGDAWEPWPPQLAAERFLEELKRIQQTLADAKGD